MLFVTIAINYLDRSNLSVAAPNLAGDLHFDPRRMGLIFSAFGWAYALLQIPGGWLVDRLSLRGFYALDLPPVVDRHGPAGVCRLLSRALRPAPFARGI